jgi:hypothetical protein
MIIRVVFLAPILALWFGLVGLMAGSNSGHVFPKNAATSHWDWCAPNEFEEYQTTAYAFCTGHRMFWGGSVVQQDI